jgi:uncharacterized membrane protein YkvA (DUF1232 family)
MNDIDYSKVDTSKYSKEYSESNFWDKVKNYATKAGGKVIYNALKLYYALQSTDTPGWAKTVILGALGYFIAPIDLIPDVIPAGGYVDDAGVIAVALLTVATCITPKIKEEAKAKMCDWFGDSEIVKVVD